MEDNVCFSIVDMARSNDHPQGCFRTAFKKLKEKFESTSQAARCEIKLEYESMKMKTHEDPELFINTLEKLARRMNEDFDMKIIDEDIITKVLNTLPREYEALVDSLQVQMDTEKGVTLDNLKEQLRSKFQRMKKSETRNRRHETILNTGMAVKQKRVYKTTKNIKEDKEIPYCHYCDKKYHREDRCWKKLRDLSLKDQDTKDKLKGRNNKEDSEFVCTMDAGNQDQWILDSGASQHVTNQYKLLYDKSNINEVMEMANETTEECKIKGKVKLRIDNKTIILTDVYYLESSKNIISLTKFMSKGYQVIGEGDHFLIIKDNKSIISTSKIKTKHGFVVSIYPKYDLNNITYDLMHQWLVHPGKNATLKSAEILGEKISTCPSSILP